jgi:hypothetical protein
MNRGEKRSLELRGEDINVLNHTQFSGIDTTQWFDNRGNPVDALFLEPNPGRRARSLIWV